MIIIIFNNEYFCKKLYISVLVVKQGGHRSWKLRLQRRLGRVERCQQCSNERQSNEEEAWNLRYIKINNKLIIK